MAELKSSPGKWSRITLNLEKLRLTYFLADFNVQERVGKPFLVVSVSSLVAQYLPVYTEMFKRFGQQMVPRYWIRGFPCIWKLQQMKGKFLQENLRELNSATIT